MDLAIPHRAKRSAVRIRAHHVRWRLLHKVRGSWQREIGQHPRPLNGNRSGNYKRFCEISRPKRAVTGPLRRCKWGRSDPVGISVRPESPETAVPKLKRQSPDPHLGLFATMTTMDLRHCDEAGFTSDKIATNRLILAQESSRQPPHNGCGLNRTPAGRWHRHRPQGQARCRP